MKPLSHWAPTPLALLAGLLTDIDDTLTSEGHITKDAVDALESLRQQGVPVIPITGRPVGWSEPFASVWPVNAIVAENGAVALIRQSNGVLDKRYQQDATTRGANFLRMQQVLAQIESDVPGAQRATDSPGRECDIAIDHCVQIMRAAGMNATVSSIHINGWYGAHNKLEGARWIVRELFGRDLDAEMDRWVYVGDSTNDQIMFQHFPHSIGVANIARFEPQLTHLPRYVTQGERGAGFAEVARAILSQKDR